MGHTNSTPNIGLPQFIGTDKPTWLGDVNGAMSTIDTKVGSIDAAIATTDAKADNAVADASGAVTTATNAVNTAGAASTTATQANNLATQALTVANNTADLCTQSIVPDVNANKAAIGTLADLTTSAKDNLVDAINEVAQGGGGGTAKKQIYVSLDGTSQNNAYAVMDGVKYPAPISIPGYITSVTYGNSGNYDILTAKDGTYVALTKSTTPCGVITSGTAVTVNSAPPANTTDTFLIELEA